MFEALKNFPFLLSLEIFAFDRHGVKLSMNEFGTALTVTQAVLPSTLVQNQLSTVKNQVRTMTDHINANRTCYKRNSAQLCMTIFCDST